MSDDLVKQKYFTRRSFIFRGLQLLILSVFTSRMFYLQIVNGKKYSALAENNKNRIFMERPLRGLIVDCNGEIIAGNELSYRVLFDTGNLDPSLIEEICSTVSSIVDKEVNRSFIDRVKRKKRGGIFVLYKKISWEDLSKMELYAPNLTGVYFTPFYNRFYNFAESCAHVIGYVREESIRDEKAKLEMDVGVSGIELSMDSSLRGIPGISIREVDAKGKNSRELSRISSVKGNDVKLTINAHLQDRIYNLLIKTEKGKGSVVILDVETGAVLAICSAPSYDNNKLISGFSRSEWVEISTSKDLHFLNRAVAMPIQPASTFKTITAIAALQSGLITRESMFECKGGIMFGGRYFRCWDEHGHGELNVHEAIVNSCNVFFYEVAKKIDLDDVTAVAKKFGYGEKFNIGVGVETAGVLPTKDWRFNNAIMNWNIGDTMNVGIGQGILSVPVLNIAIKVARIATGKSVVPTLIDQSFGDVTFPEMDISMEHLSLVRDAMFHVVNRGTASYFIGKRSGEMMDLAGKTGTVQSVIRAADMNHGLFMSYFPYSKPKYAAVVFLEHAGSSGRAVGLFRKIMKVFREMYSIKI